MTSSHAAPRLNQDRTQEALSAVARLIARQAAEAWLADSRLRPARRRQVAQEPGDSPQAYRRRWWHRRGPLTGLQRTGSRCAHMNAIDPGCVKPSKQSPARNKRIELATRANPSCASSSLFESILRSNDSQNGFQTAKTLS